MRIAILAIIFPSVVLADSFYIEYDITIDGEGSFRVVEPTFNVAQIF